jgi:integrase
LTDPIEVTRWLKRRWRRERDKKRVRKALLEQFPEIVDKDPIELLRNALRDQLRGDLPTELEDALDRYFENLAAKGTKAAPRSAARWYATIRGFYTDSGVRLSKYPKKFTPPPPPTFPLTQDKVKRMVRTGKDPRDKALIAFLAQTGQKTGVLLAMKWKFIDITDSRGVVHVPEPEEFKNRSGEPAYVSRDPYVFIVGRDTMRLLGKPPKDKEKWLFDISERQIGRVVKQAAKDADIEERVTPSTFRGYWRAQMAEGGVWQDTLLEYMMGYDIPRIATRSGYLRWQNLLDKYKRAESRLEVL